ncbi:MAG: TlpA disulfide reductase family protein [Pirellulales bacterium]
MLPLVDLIHIAVLVLIGGIMFNFRGCLVGLLSCFATSVSLGQNLLERESDFLKSPPLVGAPMPEVSVFLSDGTTFNTANLKGKYTVLTFGCLTCPPSMWNIAELEAVHRDYHAKGVNFYFIYKSLAHPELAGGFVQPFTLEERLGQARRAIEQFGTQIPWLVDAMDNRLKRALGDRPNSQFLIDPQGVVIRKRAWSNPSQVRTDLEELVGRSSKLTRADELGLKLALPPEQGNTQSKVSKVPRTRMVPLQIEPQIDKNGTPFFAKLRAEASQKLVFDGKGELYIGFHLDPLYGSKWNNLGGEVSVQLNANEHVKLEPKDFVSPKTTEAIDHAPREFQVSVDSWPKDEVVKLMVRYYVCDNKETCHAVVQEYLIRLSRDIDGGGARGATAGYWDAKEFTDRLLLGDSNADGKIVRTEAAGIILPHFDRLDRDKDGALDKEEMNEVSNWLNHFHQPFMIKP